MQPEPQTREVESFVTEFASLPDGWLAIASIAGVLLLFGAVIWMYRHEGRLGASLRVRMILAGLRCAVLAVLAIIVLEPVRVRIVRKWIDSYTLLLVDDSASMDIADTYRDERTIEQMKSLGDLNLEAPIPRRDVVESLLARGDRELLRDLVKNNRVKLFSFSDETRNRATIWGEKSRESRSDRKAQPTSSESETVADSHGEEPAVQVDAAIDSTGALANKQSRPAAELLGVEDAPIRFESLGAASNVEHAIRRSVDSMGSAPIAAVVVMSDGGFNAGASAEDVGKIAREQRLSIHTLGIGDPSPPRNVRVAELNAPETAFQRDPLVISAKLTAEGLDGETIRVELRERTGDGGETEGRLVDTKPITIPLSGAVPELQFERRPETTGRHVYSLTVPTLTAETVVEDNVRQVTVNVVDSRTRVLLVSGLASWDYRYLMTPLSRDATFDLSCWLQSAGTNAVRDGTTIIDHMPTTAEELFAYDAIILMDPDRSELNEDWCRLLDTWVVEHGGGLVFAAARPHTPSLMREAAFKPLRDLLPITIDPEADLVLNQVGHYQLVPSLFEIPTAAYSHPIMQLAADPASTKLAWQGMGDIYWHYPVLREKPAATVLMRHADPRMRNSQGGHVLLATQFVGSGRSVFLGFDSSWRWRRYGDEVHNRFWVQLIRHAAEGRRLGGGRRGLLLTESDEYSVGEVITVTSRLLDGKYEPIVRGQVPVRFALGDEQGEFSLTPQRDKPGWYEGRFVAGRPGACRLTLSLPGDGTARPAEASELVRELWITRPNLETRRPQMDRDALQTLAENSFGGRYFALDETKALAAAIPDLHEEVPVRSRPRSLWDRSTTLWLLIALLGAEWGIRKWKHLL